MLTIFTSVVITLFGTIFVRQLLEFMNTPDDIIDDSCTYLFIIFCGITTTMIYNFYAEMMRALGNSKRPFIYLIISCFLNIILDLIFILVFKMGVGGVALATVISQALSAMLACIYCIRSIDYFRIKWSDIRFDLSISKACLRIGIPNAFLNVLITIGTLILQGVTNSIGTIYIAAISGGAKITTILTSPYFAISSGLSVFVSQNHGAGNIPRAKSGVNSTIKCMLLLNTAIFAIALICSNMLMRMVVGDNPEVITLGAKYTIINTLFAYSLIPLLCYKSTIQAFGRPFFPTVSGILEMVIRLLTAIYMTKYFGFYGIILTDPFTWVGTCIFFIIAYRYEIKKIECT